MDDGVLTRGRDRGRR